jgi:hypothetical protein
MWNRFYPYSHIVKVMSENVCQLMYISNIFYKITKHIEIAELVLYSIKEITVLLCIFILSIFLQIR